MINHGWAVLDKNLRYVDLDYTLARHLNNLPRVDHIDRTVEEALPLLWPFVKDILGDVLAGNEFRGTVTAPDATDVLIDYGVIYKPIFTKDWEQFWTNPNDKDAIKGVIAIVWDAEKHTNPPDVVMRESMIVQSVFQIRLRELMSALGESRNDG